MIDQEGINSLNTGAEPITYEGTEGPKSPEQDQAMALGLPEGLTLDEAVRTFDLAFPGFLSRFLRASSFGMVIG